MIEKNALDLLKRFLPTAAVFLVACAGERESLRPEESVGAAAEEPAEEPTTEPESEPEDSEEVESSDEDFEEFDEEFDDAEEVFDPLSGYNRVVYHFNDKFYFWSLRPSAKGYGLVTPEVVRVPIDQAIKNFRTPPRFLNALLQLKFKKSGSELGRLVVNSTIGIGGFFDAAEGLFEWRAPSPEDLGQTLGHYGLGGGFHFVIPLMGPSNLRDGIGLIGDSFAHPIVYFIPLYASVAIAAGDHFNRASLHLGEYESLKKDALDPYTFLREVYEQNREKKIEE